MCCTNRDWIVFAFITQVKPVDKKFFEKSWMQAQRWTVERNVFERRSIFCWHILFSDRRKRNKYFIEMCFNWEALVAILKSNIWIWYILYIWSEIVHILTGVNCSHLYADCWSCSNCSNDNLCCFGWEEPLHRIVSGREFSQFAMFGTCLIVCVYKYLTNYL